MKWLPMGTSIGRRTILLSLALFVLGVVAGSLIVSYYQGHKRAAPIAAASPAMPRQSAVTVTGPTDAMPGMNDPKYAPQAHGSAQDTVPGTVMLSPKSQQLIDVRYTEVRRADMKRTLRTVGLVQMDEENISRVHVKVAGWIEKMYLDYVGKLVKKGQPLFSLYSPDLVSTEQEYLIALKGDQMLSHAPFKDAVSGADSILRAAHDRLQFWDVTEVQIAKLKETKQVERTTTLYSPITGFVVTRNAYPQTYVTPDTNLYEIADLSTIWVLVDIFEYEVPFVHVGQPASMQLSYLPGKTYRGRVAYVYPMLDPKTRTVKVRLEFQNPNYSLKPDMYADVQLTINYGSQIVVPSEAVLNSGTKQIVFIAKPGGYFEPREIKVGNQFNGEYAVLSGLTPGEKIVASGNFLIDSESNLGDAMQGMSGMSGTPAGKK